jgi:peptidyl-prolyl cis-trans isomerase SurA
MKFLNKHIAFFTLFIITTFFNIAAQENIKEGMVMDKIVAIVGDEIIMKSDIDGKIAILKQENPNIDPNNPDIREKVLKNTIDEYLVIAKAIEDSIVVTDEEINSEWDKLKNELIQYYGSVNRIEDIYGMSFTRLQYDYRDIIRKQLLGQKIQQEKFANVKTKPMEVEEFYNMYKDSLPMIPEQFELNHIVKYINASKNAKEEVYELAKKVRDSIINGGLFSDFAKRYSEDPGTAMDGGELGWFEKGKLFPEFEKVAFELIPGKTSMPVETPFGFHIIQTLDKNKDSVLTRHILFRIGQTESDKEITKQFLLDLKDSIENGCNFEEFARKYSDETETKGFGGSLGTFTKDQLPINFKNEALELNVGEVSDPLPYNVSPSKPAFHIIYKKNQIPEHFPDLEKDYKILEQKALSFKRTQIYEEWITQLRNELYWEIK